MAKQYYYRLSQYRCMWVLIFFDLPTNTKEERKIASSFRKTLLDDGFTMFQFSIYIRFCASQENMNVHIKRIKKYLPQNGKTSIMHITDKQFGMIETFYGKVYITPKPISTQLELF